MSAFLRQLWPMVATSVVAGVILSILAPYGTFQMPLLGRLAFWVGLCIAGGVGAAGAEWGIKKSGQELSPWLRILIHSLGATLAVWLCFAGLNISIYGPPGAGFLSRLLFYIWVISAVICTVGELAGRRSKTAIDPETTARPAIYERLKPALRSADIYALSAEDHYVRVHTSKGDDLVLMRLSDAIRETAPIIGLTVHRSWWVAEQGVKSVSRAGGKTSLTLHSDTTAPVSRNNAKAVKEAGWV